MKLAVAGKGGVGKSTVTALLSMYVGSTGRDVLAIDADPDMNLSSCLGVNDDIVPLIEMEDLIAERAGGGGLVKLNPSVSDIPDRFYEQAGDVKLMVFGTVWAGGAGCTCPENAFLRELLAHLILERNEVVIVDMEAGIEHLGRGTGKGVDALLTVVEPDRRSIKTRERIRDLAKDIGIETVLTVWNKVDGEEERDFLVETLDEQPLGIIPYSEGIRKRSREGKKVPLSQGDLRKSVAEIWGGLRERYE